MTTVRLHPSELAYAFSHAGVADIIGWGRAPFLPDGTEDGDPKAWYADGAARMAAADRLIEAAGKGLTFTPQITQSVLALVDPALVLMAERKEGAGLRRLTVHVAGDTLVGLMRRTDGTFELTRYADLTAATAACVGFLGAAPRPVTAGARIDATQEALTEAAALAKAGQDDAAQAALVGLGTSDGDAASVVQAIVAPKAAGTLSVFYCADNTARSAEAFSVMTTAQDETWIIFAPASLRGPMVLERSSASALAGRVVISVAARQRIAEAAGA